MALIDQTLGEIATSLPGATRVLSRYKLDFCCGGQQTLRAACNQLHLDANHIAEQLQALGGGAGDQPDWREASNDALIDHLLTRYHARHREQLPELIRLASRVEQVHGHSADCPNGLAEHLWNMQQELESHMLKEEKILFPMLRSEPAHPHAHAPIAVMRFEHDQHGEALARLAEMTDDITPPANACNTWRALYRGLEELRDDLMLHIHLENNILFAR
ncbi:MAG TPA: iron-sulfur cluster repair protein YtfE [Pseudomonas sp.]|nr:iron-sulfur cluster repair protein YtfE [Pseudomonas sp.]